MKICTVLTRPFKVTWQANLVFGPSDCASYHFSEHAATHAHKLTPGSQLWRRDPFFGQVHSDDGNPWSEIKLTAIAPA